jgi:tRNA uridine 5-carboxymethylaminomethyl modification enzyme
MFTSRAEYRILLRQDNADERLTLRGEKEKTVSSKRVERLKEKEKMAAEIIRYMSETSIEPDKINEYLTNLGTSTLNQKVKAINIVMRPQVALMDLIRELGLEKTFGAGSSERFEEIVESAEIKIKYEGYIKREKLVADKIKRLEELKIPEDVEYTELMSISTEGRQKLTRIKPANIGQASRISGVSPSDINILLMYLGR